MARRIIRILAALAVIAGALLLLYPQISTFLSDRETERVVTRFRQETAQPAEPPVLPQPEEAEEAESPAVTEPADLAPQPEEQTPLTEEERQLQALHEALSAYNRTIFEEGQSGLQDPFDYEAPAVDLTEYGFSDNVIGVLWIPRMDVELPIYLGASRDHLANGAGLLGQTSVPLGQTDSNTVLAGHRGWRGTPKFRDIQQLQLGDKIQITTPWETLTYRVCELKIITPEDIHAILIQPGRELVTLLTCHPYRHNYQRYLVFAERSEEEPADRAADLAEAEETYLPEPRAVEVVEADGTVSLNEVEPESLTPVWDEGMYEMTDDSSRTIWLEDHMIPITLALLAVLLTAGILIRVIRRKQGG